MRRLLALVLLAGCYKQEPPGPAAPGVHPEKVSLLDLGDFPYTEGMKLPEGITKWKGKFVVVTGYVNPGTQIKDLKKFLLVKDLGSCCFGKAPQLNHFIDVVLGVGQSVNYTRDPVTIRGILEIGEVRDGDWVLCVYSMKDAKVVK